MVPLERLSARARCRVLSMGFLADEEQAIMWRGLVLNRAVQQFLQDAHWGDLDYLLIDLPPGTGDVQMGLARLLPRTEMLVVTTPPLAAQKVAARAADMARQGYLRVAGVIENMSDFTCEHGTTYALFGTGGGPPGPPLGVPLHRLDSAPPRLGRRRRRRGARGPGEGELADVFEEMARTVAEEVAPLLETHGVLGPPDRARRSRGGGGKCGSRAANWTRPRAAQGPCHCQSESIVSAPAPRSAPPAPARAALRGHGERAQVGPQRKSGHAGAGLR